MFSAPHETRLGSSLQRGHRLHKIRCPATQPLIPVCGGLHEAHRTPATYPRLLHRKLCWRWWRTLGIPGSSLTPSETFGCSISFPMVPPFAHTNTSWVAAAGLRWVHIPSVFLFSATYPTSLSISSHLLKLGTKFHVRYLLDAGTVWPLVWLCLYPFPSGTHSGSHVGRRPPEGGCLWWRWSFSISSYIYIYTFKVMVLKSKPCTYACSLHPFVILFKSISFNSVSPILSLAFNLENIAKY